MKQITLHLAHAQSQRACLTRWLATLLPAWIPSWLFAVGMQASVFLTSLEHVQLHTRLHHALQLDVAVNGTELLWRMTPLEVFAVLVTGQVALLALLALVCAVQPAHGLRLCTRLIRISALLILVNGMALIPYLLDHIYLTV